MRADDPAYCKLACTGNALCVEAAVPNDVTLGLLRLISELAEQLPIQNRVITMAEVVAKFNITGNLSTCLRNDVIVDNGRVYNSGSSCLSLIDANTPVGRIEAQLGVTPNIYSDVTSAPGIALFPRTGAGGEYFSLKFNKENLQRKWGGPIALSTRLNPIALATAVDAELGRSCVRVTPRKDKEEKLIETISALNSNPAVVDRMVRDIKSYAAKVPPNIVRPTPTGKYAPHYPILAPLTEDRTVMLGVLNESDRNALENVEYDVSIAGRRTSIPLKNALFALDAQLCRTAIGDPKNIVFNDFYPPVTSGTNVDDELMEFRNLQAGRLLMCTFGYEMFNDALKARLRSAESALQQP